MRRRAFGEAIPTSTLGGIDLRCISDRDEGSGVLLIRFFIAAVSETTELTEEERSRERCGGNDVVLSGLRGCKDCRFSFSRFFCAASTACLVSVRNPSQTPKKSSKGRGFCVSILN